MPKLRSRGDEDLQPPDVLRVKQAVVILVNNY